MGSSIFTLWFSHRNNIDCNRVFRSYNVDDNENQYFDDKNKCVPFYQTNKNSFNQIIINGNIDKVNFMNNLVASYEKNNVNDNCKYLVKTDDRKLMRMKINVLKFLFQKLMKINIF